MVAFGVILLALVHEPTPWEVVAYGKQLNVNRIDSRLGSERYDAWLARTLGPDATITWESDDCGEGGQGYGNVPVCITAQAKLRPRGRVVISISVGSFRGGFGGVPVIFFGMIEGLGPREHFDDLQLLASKVRAAQALAAEMSRLSDVPPDDDAWIRGVQRMPAARLVRRSSADTAFGDWVAARAGPRAGGATAAKEAIAVEVTRPGIVFAVLRYSRFGGGPPCCMESSKAVVMPAP